MIATSTIKSTKQLLTTILILTCILSLAYARQHTLAQGEEICIHKNDCAKAPYAVCVGGFCEHKEIFPMLNSELIGIVTLPLLLGLANIGGIGGGGLVIPLAMGCWGFSTTEAVAISNSTVFLGALLRFFGFSIKQKHPYADRTVIDYNIASIMMPAVFFGSFTGLYLANLLPESIIMILMTLILIKLTYNTYVKTVSLYTKETLERQNYQQLASETKISPFQSVIGSPKSSKNSSSSLAKPAVSAAKPKIIVQEKPKEQDQNQNSQYIELAGEPMSLEPLYIASKNSDSYRNSDADSKSFEKSPMVKIWNLQWREQTDLRQWRHHLSAFILICVAFTVQLLRGTEKSPSIAGIQTCSTTDNVIMGSFLLFSTLLVVYEVKRVQSEQSMKAMSGDSLVEGELDLSGANLIKLLLGSMLGGVVGAMGLGGGVVFNPVLLSLGLPPTVVAATGMYLILFSQASNTAIYYLIGNLPLDFAAWIGLCSCIGILFCLITVTKLIQRTGRQSVVVLILTVILLASAIMTPLFSMPQLLSKQDQGINIWAFSNPCA